MIRVNCLNCQKVSFKRRKQYKFCSITCSNRYNLNGLNKVKLPSPSKRLAEFVGICLGDGCTTYYQVSVTLNAIVDEEYALYVLDLAKNLFPGATFSFPRRTDENALIVKVNSKVATEFMKSMGIVSYAKYIPSWILDNADYRKQCIRGLFDTEGSISFKRYKSRKGIRVYKQLNFRNADINLMTFVRDNLVALGLKPTMTLKRSLYLSNHKDIDTFRQLIGFSNPKLFQRSLIYGIDAYNKHYK